MNKHKKTEPSYNQRNLHKLHRFMDKLGTDTVRRDIKWEEYTSEEMTSRGYNLMPELFRKDYRQFNSDCKEDVLPFDLPPQELDEIISYNSQFNETATVAKGNCYIGVIQGEARVYLVQVEVDRKTGWEVYLSSKSFDKVFTTIEGPTSALAEDILTLMGHIKLARLDASISYELGQWLDRYLGIEQA